MTAKEGKMDKETEMEGVESTCCQWIGVELQVTFAKKIKNNKNNNNVGFYWLYWTCINVHFLQVSLIYMIMETSAFIYTVNVLATLYSSPAQKNGKTWCRLFASKIWWRRS